MLTWHIILFLISLFILIKSSRLVVRFIISIADFFNISDYTAAFLIMSFATTLPEFVVGINAALNNASTLSLGNSFGSSIANVALVLGLTALITNNLKTVGRASKYEMWPALIAAILPVSLLLDGALSRQDSIIILSLFFLYCFFLIFGKSFIKKEKDVFAKVRTEREKRNEFAIISKSFGGFLVAILLLLLSAYVLTINAEAIASSLNISNIIIGVFIVAIGTSLPELIFSLRSAFSKHPGLSLGNIIGASVFNTTLIIGTVSLINPIVVTGSDYKAFIISSIFMLLCIMIANIFLMTGRKLGRLEGAVLLSLYLAFIITTIVV